MNGHLILTTYECQVLMSFCKSNIDDQYLNHLFAKYLSLFLYFTILLLHIQYHLYCLDFRGKDAINLRQCCWSYLLFSKICSHERLDNEKNTFANILKNCSYLKWFILIYLDVDITWCNSNIIKDCWNCNIQIRMHLWLNKITLNQILVDIFSYNHSKLVI